MNGQLLLVTLPILLFGVMVTVFFKHEGKAEMCGEASPDSHLSQAPCFLGKQPFVCLKH